MKSTLYQPSSASAFPNVTILGGGIGGCATALALAESGANVTIIDRSELLSGTSDRTPGRMGLGFHYLSDPDTALTYLRATIEFVTKHPGFMIGEKDADAHHLSHGLYLVTKDSFVPASVIMERTKQIQMEYAALVEADKSNAVFGPPESFYRVLDSREYAKDIAVDKVDLAIETQEHLLDWPEFKKYMLEKITSHPNITIEKHHKVIGAAYAKNGGFTISTQTANGQLRSIDSGYVVNATWENIEAIDHKMGFPMAQNSRTNRLKLLVEIDIPQEFHNKPSMFFCMGPHGMFSNMGNGIGRITYAPVTNYGNNMDLDVPAQYRKWLDHGLSPQETEEYGKKIVDGVAQYIPALKGANIRSILPGIVKSKGEVDIYAPNSDFHKRDYSGVEERQIGWIDNACMKLFYAEKNAAQIMDAHKQHVEADKVIGRQLAKAPFLSKPHVIRDAINTHLRRNFTPLDILDGQTRDLTSSMTSKAAVNLQVVGKFTAKVVSKSDINNDSLLIAQLALALSIKSRQEASYSCGFNSFSDRFHQNLVFPKAILVR